ncbi:helitron_like_N domain-containing protein [Caerostris darwini]|uniref:Helitron_like_N domain-containing protein n=1 Tax=Caerostris darwini TaxID=1538125 RepID=A0AAV4Q078_9ARAC|nr:helitron_like_N domain-containing protein [Caerostris darwini]
MPVDVLRGPSCQQIKPRQQTLLKGIGQQKDVRKSSEHRDERLRLQRERSRAAREQHVARYRAQDQERQQYSCPLTRMSFFRLAFEYSPHINYSAHSKIAIGPMDQLCRYCQALKFRYEPPGMCCSLGKVVLLPLLSPPKPLRSLLAVSPQLRNDNLQIVIRADKTPSGEHAGRFNAPIVEEVAIIMVGDPVDNRAIKITRRDNTVHVISDLHSSYDALQYPLIFWQGQDGYHINIKQVHPVTGNETNKKVSSMCYYAYRLMIRNNQDNYILRYRQLYHQYVVDMYAKIESERLRFLRFNQVKLRSEDYIHLRDAIIRNNDEKLNINNFGNAFILPSSYIGSPRNMQEYVQDAMTYVRHYGRPDLFITFTCNPNWEEIQALLLPGQQSIQRHDIVARMPRRIMATKKEIIDKSVVDGNQPSSQLQTLSPI